MYEITQWNGKQELAELDNTTISIDPILLNDAILKLMNEDTTIEDDVIDIDFNFGLKKADRYVQILVEWCRGSDKSGAEVLE